MTDPARQQLDRAIDIYGRQMKIDGIAESMAVLEKVRGWLTKQPDTKRQKEQRTWCDHEIKTMRARIEQLKGGAQ